MAYALPVALIVMVITHMLTMRAADDRSRRLWQHITELEGDKRALTESLCRAQGKPYIQPEGKRDLVPSDGWFDGKVEIKVSNAN